MIHLDHRKALCGDLSRLPGDTGITIMAPDERIEFAC